VYLPLGKKKCNYWWNEEISRFRKESMKSKRKAQGARTRGENGATHLSEVYKANKRKRTRAIKVNKERSWRDFCMPLDKDPWGRSYTAVMTRMVRRVQTDRVRSIVDEHFLTRPTERWQGTLRNRNREEEESDDYRISEEDLMDACRKINPNTAVGVDGIPGTAVKALVEREAVKVLRVLNTVNEQRARSRRNGR
jgi:hypothetical protein